MIYWNNVCTANITTADPNGETNPSRSAPAA